ncbi:diacylglycerol/lipid kinase family protein [Dyadobacter aurulentus]|uniref:diacylglycerol/lipid kinase family protein n=1 Tax=Dyadobacter sp. UC 10 TaxID=2605428 RepID=UPI0011F3ABE5|nr:diacylglycerol kinase family protein [Dyadobacter sp. UC 10]KAA0993636.1 diacylglycerol kinase [Dyadobacter sp. UC 10]
MKRTTLLHNPTAGDNDFSKKELTKLIKKEGFDCAYASVKEDGWDEFEEDSDFLIIAGGDGTVRRVAKALMKRRQLQKQYPLALLPHGTANNVACALGIDGEAKDIVQQWHHHRLKPFDIGKVQGLEEDMFFLEAFGLGIFPRLMKVMSKLESEIGDTAEERLHAAKRVLLEILQTYEARHCEIIADGKEFSGNYLMIEVMNIRSIGPNLILAPNADPGDGLLEVVLIEETHRNKFESFLRNEIDETGQEFSFKTIQAKRVKINCDWKDMHIDDERIKIEKPAEINIQIMPDMLEFILADK